MIGMDYVKELWWRHSASIAAFALFGIVACLYFFTSWLGADLGGNLFAEAFGIFFTVVLIERLVRANARRQTRAARFAAYQEANRLLSHICGTWFEIIKSTVTAPPELGSDLFSERFVEEVTAHFNFASIHGGRLPEQSWRMHLMKMPKQVGDSVDRIIQRYQLHVDPDLLSELLKLEKLPFIMLWGQADLIVQIANRPADQLPVPQDMANELVGLRELEKILVKQAGEFSNLPGFAVPFDTTFRSALQLMRDRNDIGPLIGSSRR